MKKKLLAALLSTAMVLSLAACGSTDAGSQAPAADSGAATTEQSSDTADTGSADASATQESSSYELTDLYITVDGIVITFPSGSGKFAISS